MEQDAALNAQFAWQREGGVVQVECLPDRDPDFWGCWFAVAEGFPVCTATVDYPAHGYRSMLGWVQLVRSTDNESAGEHFEPDPFGLFGDTPIPYCWYCQRPMQGVGVQIGNGSYSSSFQCSRPKSRP